MKIFRGILIVIILFVANNVYARFGYSSQPVTSIELIQKGVIGKTEAQRVNRILNSGTKYANELKDKLNAIIKSRQSEKDKVMNLQETIEEAAVEFDTLCKPSTCFKCVR